MYERFYQLRERPFALSPDPDYLYPSRVHQEALDYLRYGGRGAMRALSRITGEIGSGKTTLLQTLLRGLDSQTTVGRIVNTMLEPRELLETIMIDFGLDPTGAGAEPPSLRRFRRAPGRPAPGGAPRAARHRRSPEPGSWRRSKSCGCSRTSKPRSRSCCRSSSSASRTCATSSRRRSWSNSGSGSPSAITCARSTRTRRATTSTTGLARGARASPGVPKLRTDLIHA